MHMRDETTLNGNDFQSDSKSCDTQKPNTNLTKQQKKPSATVEPSREGESFRQHLGSRFCTKLELCRSLEDFSHRLSLLVLVLLKLSLELVCLRPCWWLLWSFWGPLRDSWLPLFFVVLLPPSSLSFGWCCFPLPPLRGGAVRSSLS